MASNYIEWYLQLINGRTQMPIDDDSGIYNVLTQNDPAEITIYSSDSGASQANPGTMTDGVIRFWTDSGTTTVDISVLTSNGHAFFLEDVSVNANHRIVVWPDKIEQALVIPYTYSGASETIVDTGFDILANMCMKDVFVRTITLGTGFTLECGTSTTTDGFILGLTVDATGYRLLSETVASLAAPTIGSFLVSTTSGAVRKFHVRANTTSGANIVYSNATSSSTAGAGYIYLIYNRVPA